ncbi:MAG: metallophosphoesterase, partial [Phycisphaerales bacterium]|nr:metallophosphoesterase [Phycisphaerales bacterium]
MRMRWVWLTSVVVAWSWGVSGAGADPGADHVGHDHHEHAHNPKHPTEAPDGERFRTSRESPVVLPLPEEKDAFFFVVFGDRTGGPAEGVSVLADAVHDTNLLEPDLVMTVGDLVQGYNQTDEWMEQMKEFKAVMDRLLCPWFPVAGNHDVYWRGEGRPPEEHEGNYEMHFGPLWYAFEHKNCWFIALYTDEANPVTGERNFGKPECQRMSDEQFAWLDQTLNDAKDAEHVFLFVHHPRWLGGQYGDDWEKVHRRLVDAGNVTAVFGGHIHRMRSDPRDGIEYVTLATVGGYQDGTVPSTGWLHQFHIVTVRPRQVALAAVPVGEVMDVREITGEMADEAAQLARLHPAITPVLEMSESGYVTGEVSVRLQNPVSRAVDITLEADSRDSRWIVLPEHRHLHLEAGESRDLRFDVTRVGGELDATYRPLQFAMDIDLLARGFRYAIPTIELAPLVHPHLHPPAPIAGEAALRLDGRTGVARVMDEQISLPDGPMTLECWFNARHFDQRTGLLCKTEGSEYGIFVSEGVPTFSLHLNGRYAEVGAPAPLTTGTWHHVAGVYDGHEVRLYIDGRLAGSVERAGRRTGNRLPLLVGADVNGAGEATSHFDGMI